MLSRWYILDERLVRRCASVHVVLGKVLVVLAAGQMLLGILTGVSRSRWDPKLVTAWAFWFAVVCVTGATCMQKKIARGQQKAHDVLPYENYHKSIVSLGMTVGGEIDDYVLFNEERLEPEKAWTSPTEYH